ncbi:hypothetical protein J3Q64DRAFT_1206048 [Phycomyces blakesleeanus]|uniref:Uncharacterized protein n=1 Tax=Phycomyces blakesleeanus TaxID=4837 RepID=A0ABR3AST7_PHYBL
MERHSVRDSIKQDIGTQTPLAVEEDHNFSSRNIFNEETSFYNNTFSIPPQKISEPTSINHTRQDSDDNQLEKSIDHSKKSSFSFDSRSIEHQTPQPPQEDNRASRLVEMLMAENVRLERLQKNLDYILLQTSELAKSPRTPFPSSENRLYESELVLQRANTREHYCRSPSTSLALPINELKKYSEVAESPRNLLDNTPSSFYRQFHSSPISATHSSSVPTPSPALPSQKPPPPPSPPPPPPPPPVQTVSSQNAPFVQTSKASDKSQQDKNV